MTSTMTMTSTSTSTSTNLSEGDAVDCDVLVVGGGAAGLGAALGAARHGARVALLERDGFLGGMATAGKVGTVCGLYLGGGGPARYVCGGFVRDFAEQLVRASRSSPVRLEPGLHVLPYDPEQFERLAGALARQARTIELRLDGTLTAVRAEGRRLVGAEARIGGRQISFRFAMLVDCTGEAAALQLAGAPRDEEIADLSAAIHFILDGVEADLNLFSERLALRRTVARAVREGRLPAACANFSIGPSAPGAKGGICLKLALPNPSLAGRKSMTEMRELEIMGRDLAKTLCGLLSAEAPAFRRARLAGRSPRVGLRGGPRLVGRATLGEADVLAGRKCADGIARGAWPIEVWNNRDQPELTFVPEGDSYEIPLDCLIARDFDNVLAAGRGFSATGRAMASARVIATALATGWAAGVTAAFQAGGQAHGRATQWLRNNEKP